MFQGLRENGTIYILDKTNIVPKLSVGYVEKRSDVYSRYGNPSMPMMTQPTDGVIDFSIRIGENVTELKKIPANMSVCSPEGHPQIMVFDSSEGVLSEIAAIKRQRKDIVDAYEPSVEALSACEHKEISQLKQVISNIDDKFETLLRALNNGGATKTKRNNEND